MRGEAVRELVHIAQTRPKQIQRSSHQKSGPDTRPPHPLRGPYTEPGQSSRISVSNKTEVIYAITKIICPASSRAKSSSRITRLSMTSNTLSWQMVKQVAGPACLFQEIY